MGSSLNEKPARAEFAPYYATYIDRVPAGDLIGTLRRQIEETASVLSGLPDERALHRYQAGKWSVKEVLGHVCDTERVMAYRLLRIARGDETPLPGYDQDALLSGAGFDLRPISEIVDEFRSVRAATLTLLGGLDDECFRRSGTANNNRVSARGLAYIIAGHELHHASVLRERYGVLAL